MFIFAEFLILSKAFRYIFALSKPQRAIYGNSIPALKTIKIHYIIETSVGGQKQKVLLRDKPQARRVLCHFSVNVLFLEADQQKSC